MVKKEIEWFRCPHCDYPIKYTFKWMRCPGCGCKFGFMDILKAIFGKDKYAND